MDPSGIDIQYEVDPSRDGRLSDRTSEHDWKRWTIGGQQGQGQLWIESPYEPHEDKPYETLRPDEITYHGEWLYPDGSLVRIEVYGADVTQDEFAAAAEEIVRTTPDHHKTTPKTQVEYRSSGRS